MHYHYLIKTVFALLQYRLETFTESRSTEWATKPHEGTCTHIQTHTNKTFSPLTARCFVLLVLTLTGEQADFYTQTAPRPWEVPAQAPNYFTNHKQEIRVPYTSSVQVTSATACRLLKSPAAHL